MCVEPLNQTGVEIDQKHQTFKIRKSISKMLQGTEALEVFLVLVSDFFFFLAFNLVCLAQAKGKKDEFHDLAIKLHCNTLLLGNNFQGVSH